MQTPNLKPSSDRPGQTHPKSRRRPESKTLLKISPGGIGSAWLTVQLPLWLAIILLLLLVTLLLAMFASPELAAKVAWALVHLVSLVPVK